LDDDAGKPRPDPGAYERRRNELAAERNRKIDEILSAEQKAKLAEMKGKPFPLFPYRGYMLSTWCHKDRRRFSSPSSRTNRAPV
jgi:hypothetical protein